ncbi:MAG: zinc-ribbon domain-containing protein [Verrucomicrobiota bacterium]|nr:zinc-ribbon domain-containing protein [Verrucomicrobiota bacterium]
MKPDYCPNCGEEVPPRAKACPGCGSDETTGWSERAHAENLGIPDDSFDYNEYIKREFEGETRSRRNRVWVVVAAILLVVFLYFTIGGMF